MCWSILHFYPQSDFHVIFFLKTSFKFYNIYSAFQLNNNEVREHLCHTVFTDDSCSKINKTYIELQFDNKALHTAIIVISYIVTTPTTVFSAAPIIVFSSTEQWHSFMKWNVSQSIGVTHFSRLLRHAWNIVGLFSFPVATRECISLFENH